MKVMRLFYELERIKALKCMKIGKIIVNHRLDEVKKIVVVIFKA